VATTPPTALDSSLVAVPTAATLGLQDPAQGSPQDVSRLLAAADDPKLLNADAVMAAFEAGASDTAVIVTLQPTAEAAELATQSELSANRPEALTPVEAPVFYDLQDPAIRTRLHATVTQAVDQTIAQLKLPGLTVTQRFSYQFGFAARVTAAALAQLLANPAVLRIEPDGVLEPHLRQGIPLMAAATPSATYDGSGMSIAICDTGIDTAHPRLGGGGSPIFNDKVIGGYDTGDNDADPRPNSTTGSAHGTACAGIAAGDLGDSGDYIGGVAPGAKLYAIKISQGTGGSATSSSMIAGWEWAITHQHDDPANPILIISTSFGGGSYASACDTVVPAMTTAAANAVAAGITIFASSGNDGYCSSMGWPACISHVNSVGAVYDANIGTYNPCVNANSCATKIATTGCDTGFYVAESTVADKVTAYSNSASFLTLFAPANQAYSADIVGAGGYSTGDFTSSFGGTSAACPYAAGAAAVLQSAAKAKTGSYLTPAQVVSYLTTHGDIRTDGKVTSVQKPRINLARAVSALPTTTVPTAPSGLTAAAASTSQINLSWVDNSNNETGFYIERKTGSGGTYAQIGSVGAGVRSYASTGLTAGTTYYYRVRAYNGSGNSGYSNEAYATTLSGCSSSTTAISVGTSRSGTLATTDCQSTLRAGRYYDNFTFAATAGTTYTIDMTSSFDNYLFLLNSSGAQLAFNDDYSGGNARIVYTPTVSGTLTIHATSYGSGVTGSYTVVVR
jgi:subtilisin family serine protease